MMKNLYSAFAVVNNGIREWEVKISGLYQTKEDAKRGIERFKRTYRGTNIKVVRTKIVSAPDVTRAEINPNRR